MDVTLRAVGNYIRNRFESIQINERTKVTLQNKKNIEGYLYMLENWVREFDGDPEVKGYEGTSINTAQVARTFAYIQSNLPGGNNQDHPVTKLWDELTKDIPYEEFYKSGNPSRVKYANSIRVFIEGVCQYLENSSVTLSRSDRNKPESWEIMSKRYFNELQFLRDEGYVINISESNDIAQVVITIPQTPRHKYTQASGLIPISNARYQQTFLKNLRYNLSNFGNEPRSKDCLGPEDSAKSCIQLFAHCDLPNKT
jgi:hypothetical protein